jgi:peroxiredoxin
LYDISYKYSINRGIWQETILNISKYALYLGFLFIFSSYTSLGQDFVWAPDFPEGSSIPVLEAPDQDSQLQTLTSLSGEKGLMLFFSRSFDWCPFCKAQLKNIIAIQDEMAALGFNIASMTYDPVETLKLVESDFGVTFSMLHDEGIKHVDAFGIRNSDPGPDSFAYGIPHPGIMLINPDGIIMRKFAEENFRERPDLSYVLEVARGL